MTRSPDLYGIVCIILGTYQGVFFFAISIFDAPSSWTALFFTGHFMTLKCLVV